MLRQELSGRDQHHSLNDQLTQPTPMNPDYHPNNENDENDWATPSFPNHSRTTNTETDHNTMHRKRSIRIDSHILEVDDIPSCYEQEDDEDPYSRPRTATATSGDTFTNPATNRNQNNHRLSEIITTIQHCMTTCIQQIIQSLQWIMNLCLQTFRSNNNNNTRNTTTTNTSTTTNPFLFTTYS